MAILTDDADIRRLLQAARVIAVVGVSTNPERTSHDIARRVLDAGRWRVHLVNPVYAGRELFGRPILASLAEVPEPVDIVDVFRRPDAVEPIVKDALAAGARAVWFQPGTENPEVIRRYADRLDLVTGACLGVMAGRAAGPGAP
ncbi:CoA-binding protein [Dissulfurirhabdus thermomarina]|uniref:CoA-binding protein n=1 Tax=Dissulfurirhabdus thermomarina TaxID=1765737 RepID=A0A6N9TQ29_DISTH|nr:CoA-binding protein [Dissulfurirhabdus thermomarina]NDY43148.1 CoA-binding protein [Dissulfurirhabdus thermomarina]NMX22907.1 CoA-binding protein [Dissulfurirhabdus thermomarina]